MIQLTNNERLAVMSALYREDKEKMGEPLEGIAKETYSKIAEPQEQIEMTPLEMMRAMVALFTIESEGLSQDELSALEKIGKAYRKTSVYQELLNLSK